MDFLEWDQAVRAAVFGGIFLIALFAVLWVWYDGAGSLGSARWLWRAGLTLLVLLTVPAVVLGAANLDAGKEDLFNITAWVAIGSAVLALFGTATYGIFYRATLDAWPRLPDPDPGDDGVTIRRPLPAPVEENDETRPLPRSPRIARADAYFLAKSGRAKGQQFPIDDSRPAIIGRAGGEATIEIDDERVSSAHAQVRLVNGNYTYVDMNSTNGSFLIVEGRSEAIRKPQVLMDGDEVRVGHTVLAFVDTRKGSNR